MKMSEPVQIFSTRSYTKLADDVCRMHKGERGQFEFKIFPDGERYHRVIGCV